MRVPILAAAVGVMTLFCSPQPSGTAAMIEDKTYPVTIQGLGRIPPRVEPLAAVRGELDGRFDPCRLEPGYIPSPLREQTVNFTASVGEDQ
jgi:hypothetical protein